MNPMWLRPTSSSSFRTRIPNFLSIGIFLSQSFLKSPSNLLTMNPHRTPLYDWHVSHGDVVDFAGWEMPVRFSNIIEEHMAVRDAVGIFDVSHMGRIHVRGKHAKDFIDLIVPRNVKRMSPDRAGYTYVLNENGGFKDDVIVTVLDDDHIFFVCNASNRKKIVNWLLTHLKTIRSVFSDFDVKLQDVTFQSAMIAIQGPAAPELMKRVFGTVPARWRVAHGSFKDYDVLLTGTGYTGEVGGEITIEIEDKEELKKVAIEIWKALLEHGKNLAIKPCGLGARDSLRMEAGYCLYGNDIDEQITPKEAGLFFSPFADNEKEWYIGKDALETKDPAQIRIGFIMLEKGIPRHGYDILNSQGEKIGWVSSGTQSPLLHSGIGMGYVSTDYGNPDTDLLIQIRKKQVKAKVAKFPLYNSAKYGVSRQQSP